MSIMHIAARTNYFRVKDLEAFKAGLAGYDVEIVTSKRHPDYIALLAPEGSDFLDHIETEDGDFQPFNLHEYVWKHLDSDSVVIFMSGYILKDASVSGLAAAYNAKGESRRLDLDDIYTLAKELLSTDIEPTRAEN